MLFHKQVSKTTQILIFICNLSLILFSVSTLAAGNTGLMNQARNRAFQLNKEILTNLEMVDGDSTVLFSGRVIRGADGKLQLSIDGIQNVEPIGRYRSLNNEQDIEYITFEEMIEKAHQNTSKPIANDHGSSNPPMMYGGGAALE